jgi:hypothetical protein
MNDLLYLYITNHFLFMLLTKELKFRIAGNVVNYYRENNIDVTFNQVNTLPIELVNPNSHLIVDAKCDVCDKEVKIQYRRYIQSINRGGYYTCSSSCGSEKRKKSFKEKYGDESPFKTDNFKIKSQDSFIKKYGATHFRKSDKWMGKNSDNEVKKRKETIFNQFMIDNPNVIGQDDENFIIKCEIHGEVPLSKGIYSNRKIVGTELCGLCKPIESNISGKEIIMRKFITENYDGLIVKSHKINRKELDVYLPELKLAIEFNGLRWHSDLFKDKNYHIDKTTLCRDNEIRLVHIFEDDFDYKLPIVQSIILNLIGKSNKIYARKTEIKQIKNKKELKDFLTTNHLQGFVNSNINYGLYYEGELVSVMTFMTSRKIFNSKVNEGHYELVRFCNKLNHSVVGGASKLFKKFIQDFQPKNVLSYCDISWANGNLYKNLGFEYDGITKPNYHYVIKDKRENRINYQKHKLVKMGYDSSLTENEIMNNLGHFRIYNCGNERYTIKF